MKRRVVVGGIIAIVCFVLYQFLFADHHSRLKVEKPEETAYIEAISQRPPDPSESASTQLKNSLQKIIKQGSVEFEVQDIVAAKKMINDLVKQFSAYTSSEKEDVYRGGPQYQTVVRVPADKLNDFVAKLDPIAKKMSSKNMSSKDVTDEYIDLSARLVTKRELEENYLEILHKATKVSEMLEVERELEDVRGQIESMQGRIEYINNQVSYSSLSITYYQLIVPVEEVTFGSKVANSLASGWLSLLDFIVGILYAWPLLILAPIVIWLAVRLSRKRFQVIERPTV
jgi:hypothetical protein